jgi:hypothetical protein
MVQAQERNMQHWIVANKQARKSKQGKATPPGVYRLYNVLRVDCLLQIMSDEA